MEGENRCVGWVGGEGGGFTYMKQVVEESRRRLERREMAEELMEVSEVEVPFAEHQMQLGTDCRPDIGISGMGRCCCENVWTHHGAETDTRLNEGSSSGHVGGTLPVAFTAVLNALNVDRWWWCWGGGGEEEREGLFNVCQARIV